MDGVDQLVVGGLAAAPVAALVGWLLGVRRGRRRSATENQIGALRVEAHRLGQRIAELDAALTLTEQERDRLLRSRDENRLEADRLDTELAATKARVTAQTNQLAQDRATWAHERTAFENELHAHREREAALEADLDRVSSALREAETQLEGIRVALETRDATISDLQARIDSLEADRAPVLTEPDDLQLIDGVGAVLEQMLHEAGISTYRELADLASRNGLPDGELAEFLGRIRREDWSAQARLLHRLKYGEDL